MKFPAAQPQQLPNITFFGDSSSRDKDFMVAGGFAVAGNRIQEIEDHVAFLRDDGRIRSEFHWSDYRGGSRKPAYEKLVDYAFGLVSRKHAALHLLVAPFKDYDHRAKPGEDRDTSVNRMYYQLCVHRLGQFYGKSRAIHVRLDAGNDSADICDMRNQVCADAYGKYSTLANCFRSIEPLPSERSGIIQMTDVIIGAVAAKVNNVVYAKPPKAELADYVLRASGRRGWDASTPIKARFLTVWHFKGKLVGVPRSPSSG